MNARLHTLLTDAEARLAPEDQDALADLIEAFVENRDDDPHFTAEELAHIRRLDAEPFVEADPVRVAALFRLA
jgi:hypothetical protein